MSAPSDIYQWLALGASFITVLALAALVWLLVAVRRLRKAQRVILGDEQRDIVAHAEALQHDFALLRDWLEEATAKIEQRMAVAETRLDGAVAYSAMVRYDAYGEMSGRQSSTVALLDSHHSGVVLSAILHRSHSHLYVKQLVNGKSDIELSPEEQQAVQKALAAGPEIKVKKLKAEQHA
ncbi:MAG: DUF4446 family protein [Thermoleophilaceae bacterium]|nr:DUF4446 family protein [Thermoleophilaceae bacterium]